ncbi:MAG: family 20 glycosylhydrolase, partial [Pseudomonadota bacterium]
MGVRSSWACGIRTDIRRSKRRGPWGHAASVRNQIAAKQQRTAGRDEYECGEEHDFPSRFALCPFCPTRSGVGSHAARFIAGARAHGGACRRVPAGEEAYRIQVETRRIVVRASGDAGLFYGATTLWQLATLNPGRGGVDIPAVTINDAPRFAWRGLMLDSARHFQSVSFVKHFIDAMATEKFNVLHWHLTDDQGWRLEIKKYPRLTTIGAWNTPAGDAGLHQRRSGGFYTQAQVREVVAYAAARHITIVPEIEMPGHATAAIAAYPQFGAALTPPSAVGHDWGVYPNLYNTDDATFTF